jgi:hypothetical protein
MSEHTIRIEGGHVKFVYDDELGDLLDEGTPAVCRVSHVEPVTMLDDNGRPYAGWQADMRPVGGPVLGANTPFKTRAEALAAERCWLTKEKGL